MAGGIWKEWPTYSIHVRIRKNEIEISSIPRYQKTPLLPQEKAAACASSPTAVKEWTRAKYYLSVDRKDNLPGMVHSFCRHWDASIPRTRYLVKECLKWEELQLDFRHWRSTLQLQLLKMQLHTNAQTTAITKRGPETRISQKMLGLTEITIKLLPIYYT